MGGLAGYWFGWWSEEMRQWEYRKLDLNQLPRKSNDVDLLNDAGEEGWELVGITSNNMAYLKREVAAPDEPKARTKTAARRA